MRRRCCTPSSYLFGWLDEPYLRTLRDFGGLQAYPSRTKDPVPVDYSTAPSGSAPRHRSSVRSCSATSTTMASSDVRAAASSRLIGDAELDEGNIWEAILDPATRGLSEAVWVIDLNRQSLDRVVPVIRADALERG